MSCCVPYKTTTNAFGVLTFCRQRVLVQSRNLAGTTLPRNRLRVAKVAVQQHVGYTDIRFLVLTIATYSSCDVTSQQTSSMFFPQKMKNQPHKNPAAAGSSPQHPQLPTTCTPKRITSARASVLWLQLLEKKNAGNKQSGCLSPSVCPAQSPQKTRLPLCSNLRLNL